MGVHKLWDILLTIAVQKRIEDLSGQVLAIDASLWIVKVNSIFQNIDEGLKCIFNKLLWLKKNNIKPIFVFDGDTPALKRKTLQERRSRRKQVNDFDITKKVQIQVVKTVTGVNNSSKQQSQSAYMQKSKQLDKMLDNLLKFSESSNPIELSEKLSLQGQVLNKKYELACEINPQIQSKHGNLDYFGSLDIETKQEILQQVNEKDMPSRREIRQLKDGLTEQQKILYQMEIIKKKSKIRELQDNLYRKVMTKKIQNGYEVIQGIYNGKKVIQKKKIKQKTFDQWAFHGTRKQTCNNFKQIFQKIKAPEQSNNTQLEPGEHENNFFDKIFTQSYNNQNNSSSRSSFQQISQRLSDHHRTNKFNKRDDYQPKPKVRAEQNKQKQEEEKQLTYDNAFDDVEPKNQNQGNRRQKQVNGDDLDNFPDFVMVQPLDQLNTSSSNVHFQNMLDILGISYMIAPYEAEAQCAALQQMGLVDGVVTEDSDVFLFGARKVYRGVFQDNIKLYAMGKIQEKLHLTREKLILFALMLGSDYTDGIKGIGIVNAMQILKVHHDIHSLQRFTNWAKNADILQDDEQNKTEYLLQSAASQDEREFYKLHRKFKNYWHVHPLFPQKKIYEAYQNPDVQDSQQVQKRVLSKKQIHIDALKKVMQEKFKMVPLQIELNLKIFTKQFQKRSQPQITDYLQTGPFAQIVSKRLQKALHRSEINH